jgi:acetyl-CoA acetyltransferase
MDAYIVAARARTPAGRHGFILADQRRDDPAALATGEAMRPTEVESAAVDEVMPFAARETGEDNRTAARMASLVAGFPVSVPGLTLNRVCVIGVGQGFFAVLVERE